MKVLYGITKSNWGGAQRYVFDLAVAAREAGHDVAVLCGGGGVLTQKLDETGVRVIKLPTLERDVRWKAELKSFWQILQILKSERPDILHLNSSKMGAMGALAGRLARVPKIIFTAHGWAFNEPRHWAQKIIIEEIAWLTLLLAHKTICVSEDVMRAVATKPFLAGKLEVIHNGIEAFSVPKRQHTRDNLTIGTISELHKVKGLDVSVRGFARAFKYTDTVFEIIGDGDERQNLEELAKELGIESQVHFLGFKENAREYLSEFDIFVLASRSEALGYVLLEAGIARLPVIASRVGGIPEVIKDDDTGLLFESERVQELADLLKRLSTDVEERKRLGKNLHEFVAERFTKERMLRKTLNLYR